MKRKTCQVHHRVLHLQHGVLDLAGLVYENDLPGALKFDNNADSNGAPYRSFITDEISNYILPSSLYVPCSGNCTNQSHTRT